MGRLFEMPPGDFIDSQGYVTRQALMHPTSWPTTSHSYHLPLTITHHYSYDSGTWQRIEKLYHSALELEPPSKRAAFLREACAGDEAVAKSKHY